MILFSILWVSAIKRRKRSNATLDFLLSRWIAFCLTTSRSATSSVCFPLIYLSKRPSLPLLFLIFLSFFFLLLFHSSGSYSVPIIWCVNPTWLRLSLDLLVSITSLLPLIIPKPAHKEEVIKFVIRNLHRTLCSHLLFFKKDIFISKLFSTLQKKIIIFRTTIKSWIETFLLNKALLFNLLLSVFRYEKYECV